MPLHSHDVPLSKRFFPGLLPIIGDDRYQQVLTGYRDLYRSCVMPQNVRLQWHLVQGILPGLALYQILRESGESQANALRSVDKVFEKLFAGKITRMKRIGKLPVIYPLLRLFVRPLMRQYPSEGWRIDWRQNDRKAIRFDMQSCYYLDTLARYGAPELTASFCRVDDLVYGNMSPHVAWRRTMTIAGGDAYCDFCFARETKPDMERNYNSKSSERRKK